MINLKKYISQTLSKMPLNIDVEFEVWIDKYGNVLDVYSSSHTNKLKFTVKNVSKVNYPKE